MMDIPGLPFADQEEGMMKDIKDMSSKLKNASMKSTHEAFLALLRNQYWQQLDDGEFIAGTKEAEMLLTSVSLSFPHSYTHLSDLEHVLRRLQGSHLDSGTEDEALNEMLEESHSVG